MYYLWTRELNVFPMWVVLIELLIILIAIILETIDIYHILQLSSYNIDQYLIWLKNNKKKYRINKLLFIILFIITILLTVATVMVNDIYFAFLTVFGWPLIIEIGCTIFSIIIICRAFKNRKKKKPLKYTKRIIRNIISTIVLYAIIIIPVVCIIIFNNESEDEVLMEIFLKLGFLILAPMLTFISFLMVYPIENIIKYLYIRKAKNKLKNMNNLEVIGITGSYGKTSVKNYLYKLLSIKYNVSTGPGSYNVPNGACIAINEYLKSYDDIFIQEMGARRVGDIKEMCDIVEPIDAIITEVGNMHLDTFKNIENVLKTKMELFSHVYDKNNHIILLNGDNDLIRNYVIEKVGDINNKNIYFVGEKDDNNFIIKNIKSDKNGANFDIKININEDNKINNEILNFNTKLIGKNNILDISFAIAFSILKDIDIYNIKEEVRRLEQVKNRLEVINVDDDTIIINDAYNSNPKGAKNAIDALSSFEGYEKIIVTPGMVELGDKQYEENKNMASYAYDKLDKIIAVGKTNKDAIIEGGKDKCIYIDKEEDAIIEARKENNKKVILLENDLTDNY